MAFKFKDYIFGGEDNYYYEDEESEEGQEEQKSNFTESNNNNATRPTNERRANVIKMDGSRGEPAKIALYEPRTYADAQTIATQLLGGEAVIVNLGSIDENTGKRILDYLGGTAFAVDGTIERVGERIFLATPHNFEISGTISQNLGQQFN
ncbi:MAG: cell division protein SepF [Weissella hellenica]|uniref:cell division protein SepF n=1 Tax=Weissella hellenica TaxID=46256 RepID=UPI0038893CDB